MTKTTKKTATAKTKKPTAPAIKIGEWLHVHARARGIDAGLLAKMRDTVKKSASDKNARETLSGMPEGALVLKRYDLFAVRGSQAGKRSRAAA